MSKALHDNHITETRREGKFASFLSSQLRELSSANFWRAVFAEFLGTLMLCTWTIGSGLRREEETAEVLDGALTAGFFLSIIISVLLNVSGGNVNPVVSIGLLATRQLSLMKFVFYVPAQIIGGIVAVYLIKCIFPKDMWGTLGYISSGSGVTDGQVFGCEFCLAFFLMFGTLAMFDSDRTDVKGSVPLLIGFLVAVNILFGARVSGGCMNPARNFGPALVTGNLEKQWIYWCGGLSGGALGALAYDKFLSVAAMSKPLIGCCRSRARNRAGAQNCTIAAESVAMIESKE